MLVLPTPWAGIAANFAGPGSLRSIDDEGKSSSG
jgi:hypothetical protein